MRSFRGLQVVEFSALDLPVEAGLFGEVVHEGGEPPGKALGFPDPLEGPGGVIVDANAVVGFEILHEGIKQIVDIGSRCVQALGAGWRDDMGGITAQEEIAVAHRLADKRAQRGDGFFDRRAGDELVGLVLGDALFEFMPEGLIGPVFGGVGKLALDIIAREVGVAHRAKRKTVGAVGVDQFVIDRRGFAQDAEPAKRVDFLIVAAGGGWDRVAADTVKAVAAGDECGVDSVGLAINGVGEAGAGAVGVDDLDVFDIVVDGCVDGFTGGIEVGGELGLAIHRHRMTCERFEIDLKHAVANGDLRAIMGEAFSTEPASATSFLKQIDQAAFEDPSADAAEHIVFGFALNDDRTDVVPLEELAEQQARRAAADDRNLGVVGWHVGSLLVALAVNVAGLADDGNSNRAWCFVFGDGSDDNNQNRGGSAIVTLGENIIGASGLPPFFRVANADEVGIGAPENRMGDALRCWVRSLSGFQKEALVRSARSGLTWRLVSDEGPYLNGHDAAPCPLAFLSCGMVASTMNEVLALAEKAGVTFRQLRLIQDNFYTMRGSMPKRTMVGGAEPIELLVEVDCDLDDNALHSMLLDAVQAAPLSGLVRGQVASLFKLAKNGRGLPTAKAQELAANMLPDPGGRFASARAELLDEPLMAPVGVTPKKAVALGTAGASGSLADEQNRRLNIGAVATLRDDGIKDIQQMQYSPHGTSFRFLSSEDGRAPDAASLISAGIGFCFMTQFGRFVSMLKLDLPDYRIVQDTHFSLGGASGNTGQAGSADPIETHVYLETSEDDATAQEMLDISEQTCFLHALSRTDLKTKVRVKRH